MVEVKIDMVQEEFATDKCLNLMNGPRLIRYGWCRGLRKGNYFLHHIKFETAPDFQCETMKILLN